MTSTLQNESEAGQGTSFDAHLAPSPVPSITSAARSAASKPFANRLVAVPPDAESVRRLIEAVMDRSGLSQAELARRLGVSKQAVNQYLHLKRANPSVVFVSKLVLAAGGRLLIELPAA